MLPRDSVRCSRGEEGPEQWVTCDCAGGKLMGGTATRTARRERPRAARRAQLVLLVSARDRAQDKRSTHRRDG